MRLLLLAGEESGLLYANRIAEEVRRTDPSVIIRTYADYGFESGDLAVMGFWPVLKRLPFFLRVRRTMKRAIDDWRPTCVCTVDYPGMNLQLAAYAKSKGIRAVHVVSPQVWAWKKGRIPKIVRSVDRICCFFPFEPAYYPEGVATFVGHPLAEVGGFAKSATRSSGVALLPGSRIGEIEKLLPTMLEAVRGLGEKIVIPAANAKARAAIEGILNAAKAQDVSVVDGGARHVLASARAAVVASGTATLEAALARCPTVLVYRVSFLLAAFARCVIREIRHVGLVNVIWEKCLGGDAAKDAEAPMPELLQEQCTAANIRAVIAPWLADDQQRSRAVARLDAATKMLVSDGRSIERIADEIRGCARHAPKIDGGGLTK